MPPRLQERIISRHLRQVLADLPRAVTISFDIPDLEILLEMADQSGAWSGPWWAPIG